MCFVVLEGAGGFCAKIHDELKVVGEQKMALCLAGKILSSDLVNRKAFRSLITRIWKVQERVEIEVISNHIYAFHFQSMDGRRKVLMGGNGVSTTH
ncbi:hypothetical protein QYF36_026652 [Acer negundo]|nr:hypothetical protein QYF36_026652 [Acer negundo]